MSRRTDTKSPKEALLLICEGRNTEPVFFSNFISEKHGFVFHISPKPELTKKDDKTCSNRGRRRRPKRQLNVEDDMQDDIPVSGPPPLSWVNAANKQFDTYEEIWCVFDKDGHPSCREAFDEADKIREQGHNLNIAFSSISIEYYFLLHFEYIYRSFDKSECKVSRKKAAGCMLHDAAEDFACSGDKCVNGYARKQGYWTVSKSSENIIYPILKDRLFNGIRNAELLRRESDRTEGDKPVFLRNPYTTADLLVARLLGYSILSYGQEVNVKADTTSLMISRSDDKIRIENTGKSSYILDKTFVIPEDGNSTTAISRTILHPGDRTDIVLPDTIGKMYFINGTERKLIIIR